jgi:adenosylmethionine-8-amino-7-oxononanoate aminotransferase
VDVKSLIDRDLASIWHPCSQMSDYRDFPPLPVVSASGCRLCLADGREILDAISSWWCKSLGHGHPAVTAAIQRQLASFEHVILANTTNELIVGCAESLLTACQQPAASGQPFAKVFFTDNGSSGVEVALKMALHWQQLAGQSQRTRYATLENGYHGETVGALSVSDLGLYADPYKPLLFPTLVLRGLPYRQGPDDPRWMDAAAEWPGLERQLAAQAETLAAVIYEPVLQGAGGMRIISPDLLPRLRRWADAHGVLLIADEVASGMGRCGAMLASHLAADGMPDLAVVSKGLTGGSLPLACVLTTQPVYDAFLGSWASRRAFLHSNTYAGNALAVAAAEAVLRVMRDERVCTQATATGARMRAALAARAHPRLSAVRGVGMVAAVDLLGCDPKARTGYRVYQEAVQRGALLRPLGDTLYLFPPLNAPWAEIEAMIAIMIDSVDAVCRGTAGSGFSPRNGLDAD